MDHYRLKSTDGAFALKENVLIEIQGVLVGISWHGFSQVHGSSKQAMDILVCSLGSLLLFRHCIQF